MPTPPPPAPAVPGVTMPEGLEQLSRDEGAALNEAERKIDQAMRSAGRIAGAELRRIREDRLYRATHRSFEAYCLDRWGFSLSTARRMIDVAREREKEAMAAKASQALDEGVSAPSPRAAPAPDISQREAARRKAATRAPSPAPAPAAAPSPVAPPAAPVNGAGDQGPEMRRRQNNAWMVKVVDEANKRTAVVVGRDMHAVAGGTLRAKALFEFFREVYREAMEADRAGLGGGR